MLHTQLWGCEETPGLKPTGLQREKACPKDSPKAFRDPVQNVSLETPFLKKQVTPTGNCQETNDYSDAQDSNSKTA